MQIPTTMRAMVLEEPRTPLREMTVPVPQPSPGQILIKVRACGVCRTDLHIVDGELTEPKLPLIPGHEIVGTVVAGGGNLEKGAGGDEGGGDEGVGDAGSEGEGRRTG
ncbi:MAG TPA: alcohol dehydrogenase catalytic domain-containing protein, partial [Methanothrix sp.]|nr:alcohol dehydrogenase catalytic domain-containing protein [Methanothrix sp.]